MVRLSYPLFVLTIVFFGSAAELRAESVTYRWVEAEESAATDVLAVIDDGGDGRSHGTVLNELLIGSTGNDVNEAIYSADGHRLWATALNTNRVFVFDIGPDAKDVRLYRVIEDLAELTGFLGPHDPQISDSNTENVIIRMAWSADGTGPGGIAEFARNGKLVATGIPAKPRAPQCCLIFFPVSK